MKHRQFWAIILTVMLVPVVEKHIPGEELNFLDSLTTFAWIMLIGANIADGSYVVTRRIGAVFRGDPDK